MKSRAFFQALFLVAFFVASWFFLYLSLRNEDPSEPIAPEPPPAREKPAADQPGEPEPEQADPVSVLEPDPAPPPAWSEWVDYLDSVPSPAAMRAALAELANTLLGMPRTEAIQSIVEFLESGADLRTGLAFQPGPDHRLIGSASLRAFLLDLLYRLDPQLSAEWAQSDLTDKGTSLVPDVYAVHLRNFALGSATREDARIAFLNDRLREVLGNDDWMARPVHAVAEMIDVAVYTSATSLVPDLSRLMEPTDPQMLRQAAAVAIERLVDAQPVETLNRILDQPDWPEGMENARAGYFARLDPSLEEAPSLLQEYLSSPEVDTDEARFFLLSFPNLNMSLSYNLLSSQNSATGTGQHEQIVESAIELVRAWQASPGMADMEQTLREVEEALLLRLYGRVDP